MFGIYVFWGLPEIQSSDWFFLSEDSDYPVDKTAAYHACEV